MKRIEILCVPDCPNRANAVHAVDDALASVPRSGTTVTERIITDLPAAIVAGMHGSPTILVDGCDPFSDPDVEPSMSCRLTAELPSVERLREVLSS